MKNQQEIVNYFLRNIFESKCAYEAWKTLYYSRVTNVVGKEMADRYVKIQNYHAVFFKITERSCLKNFVISVCHAFDSRPDSLSLKKADKIEYDNFFKNNSATIKQLQRVRHKIFAHRSNKLNAEDLQIPSIDKLDIFFDELEKVYNLISVKISKSSASFRNALDMKYDIENLYMNIERGESIRKKEIDIEWAWKKNKNSISSILDKK